MPTSSCWRWASPARRRAGLLDQLGVELDGRGNITTDADRRATVSKVFAAGDAARGQSLIVWAIAEGRHVASTIDEALMGCSELPRPLNLGNDQRPFC